MIKHYIVRLHRELTDSYIDYKCVFFSTNADNKPSLDFFQRVCDFNYPGWVVITYSVCDDVLKQQKENLS